MPTAHKQLAERRVRNDDTGQQHADRADHRAKLREQIVHQTGQRQPQDEQCTADQNGDDIDVNLKGTISVTEHYGIHPNIYSIIMIGSASGHTGSEFPEYAASKGGVLAYTKNVAMRIAPYQATCNSLDFGGVMTELNRPVMEDEKLWDQIMELTPLTRWMSVEEAAEWIYFMAVKNRFCTGQNILIDGLEAGNCNFIWP